MRWRGWSVVLMVGIGLSISSCTTTPCAGVGFLSTVTVDISAVRAAHPGPLDVGLCVDGACATTTPEAGATTVSAYPEDSAPAGRVREISVAVSDPAGGRLFAGQITDKPTEVVRHQGQCDQATVYDNMLIAGSDGRLTAAAVPLDEPTGEETWSG